ncbi:hypothetical protein WICANDRAFT_56960 [Wickerhamomyces anomalus NRRL Y-366-8]|uniref:GTPase-activating protein GYP5 n=1 Tax=Wickerhamomyces anomalus (strain ATCC 58044 / CBS 1984 / NCYC 433 / NRRL Y-366-8) TaxID=683960 RepID=A0A1E3NYH5_WICAA|nr:uncharacterized protein WICANDRAFT_56960 [Wickerhamomyces anomalus NRRL Y-366-8]ODQ58251.1 hypothetical protein WICANDRAFT_56960 [Wickerhamomyces anomalus NRRL Y-366-8]
MKVDEAVEVDDEPTQISEPPISQSTDPLVETEELKNETSTLEDKLKELEIITDAEAEADPKVEEKVLQSPSSIVPIKATPPELPDRSIVAPPALPKRHEQQPPEVPDRNIPPELPKRHDDGLKQFKIKTESEKSVELEENYDLLLSRLSENNEEYQAKDEISKEQINTSANTLRTSFAEKVSTLEKETEGDTTADDSEIHKVDWPFWTQVVNDYASVVKSDPSKLAKELSSGIPKQIRGIVWQLVANSNPVEFEQKFKELESQTSPFEKNINKDLSRTTFISDYGLDVDSLFKIIKAYSVLDSEVGYTQGMAFITVPLLMNMGELESFSLLHKLMFGYNIRSLYLPEMPGLHLKLYQFDRLLEDMLPNLHSHLLRQGVRSSMYASQWFLTFFAYKFPLEFVLRIFDIIITEGFESILKFAVALMQANESKLITLNFDDLLEFLKESLFSAYLIHDVITVDTYDVNKFVEDATNVKVLPITLKRYEEEYQEIHRVEKERQEEVEELRLRNTQLRKEIRKIESGYTLLNREHVQIANEMINGRMTIATLEDENKDLKEQNHNLRERVRSYQVQENIPVPTDLEEDLKRTMDRNLEVMTKNQELEDQISQLLQEVEDLKAKSVSPEPQPPSSPVHKQSHWTKKLFK